MNLLTEPQINAQTSLKRRIVKNLFTNYLTTFLGLLLGFLLVPFLIRKLGKDAYGLIILAESTIAFFEMAAVSVRMALSRYATVALAQGKKDEFVGYLSTARGLLIVSSLFVLVTGTVLSVFFDRIFKIPPQFIGQSKQLFFLITLAFAGSIPNMVFWAALYSKHRYDLINLSSSFGIIFRAVSVYLLFNFFLKDHATLTAYGVIYVCMVCIQNLAVYIWVRKILPGLHINARAFNPSQARTILSYGGLVGLGQVSNLIYINGVPVVINLLLGPVATAIYAISAKFPSILTRLFEEATWSLTSTFNELVAIQDKDKIKRLYYLYTKFVAIVTAPICFGLIFLSKPIIAFWVGKDFFISSELMPILIVPLFFQLPLGVSGCLMQAYARLRAPSLVSGAAAAFSLLLGILLGKVFHLGLFGVAIATSSVSGLYVFLFSSWYACRLAGISPLDYWRKSLFLPWLWSAIISIHCFFLMRFLLRSERYALAAGAMVLAVALYALGAYGLLLDPSEKQHLDTMLKLGNKRLRGGLPSPAVLVS